MYKDQPNESQKLIAGGSRRGPGVDAWDSAGLYVGSQGEVPDVRWNGPAAKAKITPGDKILAVNGQIYSPDRFARALREAKNQSEPIHLTIQSDTIVSTIDLNYHDGERYPVLERVEGTPAYLDDITKPLSTAHETAPAQPANQH